MKALKIATIIVFAVFLCAVVSVTFGEGIFANFGLAYRQWLRMTLLYATFILGFVFCAVLGVLFIATFLKNSRTGFKIAIGVVAILYVPIYVAFSMFFYIGILYTSDNKEWIEEENGVKYVVVDTSFLMRVTKKKYPYINSFFRSSDGIVIVDLKT
jgi:hypothetical protein